MYSASQTLNTTTSHGQDNIFFTADHHFGHKKILEYCDRPFGSVDTMDAVMIKYWNETVPEDGHVYHLSDLTLGEDADKYINKLNGTIYILNTSWHHDKRWLPRTRHPRLKKIGALTVLDTVINRELVTITLCHYPLAIWDKKHYGAWHLHGHSHGNYHGEGKIIDVGVDSWHFRPVSLSRIALRMSTIESISQLSEHEEENN